MYAYSSTFHPLFSILIFETEYFPSHLSPFSLKFKLILKHLYGYYNKIREMLMYVFSTSYRKVSVCFCYTGSCAEPFRVSIPWTHKVLDYREWQMHECKLVNYVCVLVRVYMWVLFSFQVLVLSNEYWAQNRGIRFQISIAMHMQYGTKMHTKIVFWC